MRDDNKRKGYLKVVNALLNLKLASQVFAHALRVKRKKGLIPEEAIPRSRMNKDM